ncbi:hypothetical protein A2U01_0113870, partial [Trifolium medium]|nr:hypothetical protein [Trifolium medium]
MHPHAPPRASSETGRRWEILFIVSFTQFLQNGSSDPVP